MEIKKYLLIFFLFLLTIPIIEAEKKQIPIGDDSVSLYKKPNAMKYFIAESSPIYILSDTDFILYGFSGNGSTNSPFLIQNLEIITEDDFGILIANTTLNFRISDCIVSANIMSIYLYNNSGVFSSITNNHCSNSNIYGMHILLCPNITISNNTCANTEAGIGVFFSNYSKITSNICYDNENGIIGGGSFGNIINENSCLYNLEYGIYFSYSLEINILNNYCTNSQNGICLYDVDHSIFFSNTVENSGSGLKVTFSEYCEITENMLMSNDYGLDCINSRDLWISKNVCFNCEYGIWIDDNLFSLIDYNKCNNNTLSGIYLSNCGTCIVQRNECNYNIINGIYVKYHEHSDRKDNLIIGNIFNGNLNGINLHISNAFLISNNTCSQNRYGIKLSESSYNEIIENKLQMNKEYGVYISDFTSTWNKIYSNYFICNNLEGTDTGSSQAFDNCYNNRWYNYDTNTGNYWTDFSGEGEYQIDGKYNTTDPYPFVYNYDCCNIDETTSQSILGMCGFLLLFIGLTSIANKNKKQ